MKLFILILVSALACTVRASAINFDEDALVDSDLLNNRCGGPIEADSGTLSFSPEDQDIPEGETCIWTIHLQTKSTFRLNFSSLDVVGNENCEDGAVRLYSLTNLIPAERAEGYEFCNSKPANGPYFLSESLITVIYHSSKDSASAGSGFVLNFEGISVQPIPKIHESTFSSSSSGVIRYPVSGPYPPNQVSTWLINTGSSAPVNSQLHLRFQYVALESCNVAPIDSCFCDALVLYRVSNNGALQEHSRLCGNLSNIAVEDIGQNFILAFFTDHLSSEEGTGVGFELEYMLVEPTTTTTPEPTTTPTPPQNVSTECGGILEGTSGKIEYKLNERYANDELCIWTVRTPLKAQIRFTMMSSGVEVYNDYVGLYTFNHTGLQQREIFQNQVVVPETKTLLGTVAIVVFRSDFATTSTGFSLQFEADGDTSTDIRVYEDYSSEGTSDTRYTFQYPATGFYNNFELSTFVFSKPNLVSGLDQMVHMTVTNVSLEYDEVGAKCLDALHIFRVPTWSYVMPIRPELTRFTSLGGHCQGDLEVRYAEAVILILSTDSRERQEGFALDYRVAPLF